MQNTPLVSVIALCYNQAEYIEEAVVSVFNQSYTNIELILVNDASTDESKSVIEQICRNYPQIVFINQEANLGMCRSFNNALKVAKGEFIIDLACDDYFETDKIYKQVKAFEDLDKSWGVVYTDAWLLNHQNKTKKTFFKRNGLGELLEPVLSGYVFTDVVKKYQICSATMLVRKEVLDELGGYDPSLKYEDYDFFIRASRKFKFYFLDFISTIKREVNNSDSYSWYKRGENLHLSSTATILRKYLWLCRSEEEKLAALSSIRYHMRQALYMECFSLVQDYFELLKVLKQISILDRFCLFLAKREVSFYSYYSFYRKLRGFK